MKSTFYITCAIPYVNAAPHVGHALEFVQGDAIARYHKLLGKHVTLLSGGDENALKNVQAAEKAGIPVQQFVDLNTQKFFELTRKLGCDFTIWQKGSDTAHHFPSSQKLWELCEKAGDIYQKSYEGLYCVGCETFYTPDELDDNGSVSNIREKTGNGFRENYFFRLSRYQGQLIERIANDTLRIVPLSRKNEVLSFLKQPLQDISISRSNQRAKNWGVPVPGDITQRMYVWFDALNIYQSGIGFGWDEKRYKSLWPVDVHVIGKGISRFHAVYWPAFLLSAGLAPPQSIFVHGYFTVNGQKMSKTLGNVIDPISLIEKYGADPLRYYFLREIPATADGDFSERRFAELYNADLANGLGNLVSRVAKLAEGFEFPAGDIIQIIGQSPEISPAIFAPYKRAMDDYQFDTALKLIWDNIKTTDRLINETEPWKLVGDARFKALLGAVGTIRLIGIYLEPFLPDTAQKIREQFSGPNILTNAPLFPRIA